MWSSHYNIMLFFVSCDDICPSWIPLRDEVRGRKTVEFLRLMILE